MPARPHRRHHPLFPIFVPPSTVDDMKRTSPPLPSNSLPSTFACLHGHIAARSRTFAVDIQSCSTSTLLSLKPSHQQLGFTTSALLDQFEQLLPTHITSFAALKGDFSTCVAEDR